MAASFSSLGEVGQPVGGQEDVMSSLRVRGSQVSVNQLADDADLTQNEKVLLHMNLTGQKYRRWGKYGLAAIFLAGGMLSSAFIGFLMRHGADALSRKALYDSWGIASRQDSAWESPTPQQMEDRLNKLGMLGKELTAIVASRTEYDNPPVPQPKGREAMEALAMHVSGGRTRNLIGQTVHVKDVQILGSDTVGSSPIPLKVTRYLGETGSSVTLEVTDVNTRKLLALHLNMGDVQPNNPASGGAANLLGSLRVMQETTAILQAAGSTPLEKATAERALDVIAAVGTLEGLPPVLDCTHVHLLNTVQISERVRGRLADIFIPENRMPDNAKEYMANESCWRCCSCSALASATTDCTWGTFA
uniref:Uncharacterized protein n=1 Tax=Eimeria tenella TaxID=5802 RepID=A5JNZ0_EIMTE|nr:unknown [Eimeria tenella]